MIRSVNFGDRFIRDIKSLQKRFPLMELDVKACRREIESGEILGDRVTDIGAVVYKTRLPNRSARRGKRGGFRLLYVLHGDFPPHLFQVRQERREPKRDKELSS